MDSCRLYGEPDAIVVSAEAFPDPHPTVVLNPMTSIIAVSCPSALPRSSRAAAGFAPWGMPQVRHAACLWHDRYVKQHTELLRCVDRAE
eukprot:COSAG06_NODE_3952_length_4727_cov_2.586646_4_plen_89_part_00